MMKKKKKEKRKTLYFGPAAMTGQVYGVQNSISVLYRTLMWLKKSTAAIRKQCKSIRHYK